MVRPRDRHPRADRGSAQAPPPDLPRDCSSSASETRGTRVLWGPLLNPSPHPHCCLPSVGYSAVPLCWPPQGVAGPTEWARGTARPQGRIGLCNAPKDHRLLPLLGGLVSCVLPWEAVADLGRDPSTGHLAPDSRPQPRSSLPKGRVCPQPTGELQCVSIKPNGILISIILSPPASKPTGASPFSASPHDPCLTV